MSSSLEIAGLPRSTDNGVAFAHEFGDGAVLAEMRSYSDDQLLADSSRELLESLEPRPERAENASLQVTAFPAVR